MANILYQWQKAKKIHLQYEIRIQYLGGFEDNFTDNGEWYRDFVIPGTITLEELNNLIQKILNWDDPHLYFFSIKNQKYAFFGLDELVIEDFDGIYLSCDIPFRELFLKRDDVFYYLYDFGDKHNFLLKILSISDCDTYNKNKYLVAYKGNDISQFPLWINGTPTYQFNNDNPTKLLNKRIYYNQRNYPKWKVRFIQERDFEVLQKWRKSNDKAKWAKSVVILESDSLSFEELSKKIERPVNRIKIWIKIFNAYGIEGLKKNYRKKPEKNLRTEQSKLKTKRILEILHQKPCVFAINRSNWNRESIAKVYEKQFGEKIGISTVGALINKAGYTMKKAKQVLTSPDPNYQEIVELILKTIQSLEPDELFFFVDELGPLRVKKHGGRCYIKKEDIYRIPKIQVSKGSVTLSASLSATSNQISWIYGKSKDTAAMIDLIEILYNQFHDNTKIYITWDAASWHSSNELNDWLDQFNAETRQISEGPIIEFLPLPTSSQFLNVIESIFSGMKRAVIHHSDYQSTDEMKRAISLHFVERNEYYKDNPKRAGKKIWEIDFFKDYNNITSGNYREY